MDSIAFRNALGQFATGVTIVTTCDRHGQPIGLTANSFNSASLDPPMVLWSLSRQSINADTFVACDYFAVNILADDQIELSKRFSSPVTDRFANVDTMVGAGGVPLISGCAARFQCKQTYCYEGGDHFIFVGEVVKFDQQDKPPLIFHKGGYASTQPRLVDDAATEIGGGYVDDFLLPLLARAFRHVSTPFYTRFFDDNSDIGIIEWRILSTLSDQSFTASQLSRIIPMAAEDVNEHLVRLVDLGYVRRTRREDGGIQFDCTAQGTRRIIKLLAASKAYESDALTDFSADELQTLKNQLRALIRHLEQDLDD